MPKMAKKDAKKNATLIEKNENTLSIQYNIAYITSHDKKLLIELENLSQK